MNKHSQSSILSKTNRQFYIRRKRQGEQNPDIKIDKVLKSLIKRNQNSRTNKIKHRLYTQKCQQQSMYKTSDKYFQLLQHKKTIESNLKKCNKIYINLYRTFEKCLNSSSIEQIQFYQLDFYEKFNQIIMMEIQKNKNIQNSIEIQQKNKQIKDNAVILENLRLEKQNLLLRKKIKYSITPTQEILREILKDQINFNIQVNNCNDSMQANPKIETNCTLNTTLNPKSKKRINKQPTNTNTQQILTNFVTMQRKIQIKSQQLQIMKRQIQHQKQQLFLLKQDKKALKQRITQLKIKNQNLCSEIINLQLKNKKMGVSDDSRQNIMNMQYQEILSYRNQIAEFKKLYNNLNKKHKGLIIKFKKTESDHGQKLGAMFNKQIKYFPEQLQAFQQVRGKVHPSNRIYTKVFKDKTNEKSSLYQSFLCNKQTLDNKQGVKKLFTVGTQYFYPTFYTLIQQDINFFGIDQGSFQHFNTTIKLTFIGIIRAIMDSKFNQFILKRKSIHTSSFPAFVFAWLNTYHLNQQKKIQKISSNNMSTRQSICMFYVNLMSEKLNYSWQVISFRQFLLQSFHNDELYFYLNLRYLLVGGDMSKDLSYCFQEIYYVDFNRSYTIIMRILKDTDLQTKKIYEQFLKKSIIYLRKKTYLDLHYILRIMLQYYQLKKQQQISKILHNIDMVTQSCKNNITFPQFLRIFDYHFIFLSLTQIVDLYRKCFCVGNGLISADIVITVLNQENIFLKWVQTYMLNKDIRLEQGIFGKDRKNKKQDEQFLITPHIEWLYQNQIKFRFIYNSQLARENNRIAIEQFNKNIIQHSKLTSHSLFQRLELIFQLCMMTQKKFYYSGLVSNQQLQNSIQLTTQFLINLSKLTLFRKQTHELMQYLRYQAASNKIKKFYHKKKAQMTRSILYAYSNSMTKAENNQKNQTLRSQFMQIIQQAKVKRKTGITKQVIEDGID